jgi:hypothetical protein
MLAFKNNTKKECVQMPSKRSVAAPVCGFYAIEKIDIIHASMFWMAWKVRCKGY